MEIRCRAQIYQTTLPTYTHVQLSLKIHYQNQNQSFAIYAQ